MRRLSSVIVPIFKLTAIALGVIGTGLAFLGLEQPNLSRVILFFAGFAALAFHTRHWKSVYLSEGPGGRLHVSGILVALTLPLADIARVEIVNARRIRLRLRRRTAIGRRIEFVPRWLGRQTPEIARELAHRVHASRKRQIRNRIPARGPKPRPSSNGPVRRAA